MKIRFRIVEIGLLGEFTPWNVDFYSTFDTKEEAVKKIQELEYGQYSIIEIYSKS